MQIVQKAGEVLVRCVEVRVRGEMPVGGEVQLVEVLVVGEQILTAGV